jgi:CheY-like chemotaxis protein
MNERILIAEDDADMRELLEEILSDVGYETITAANGRFALRHVENEQEQIDLVLTDVQMPELKGDELLAKVRQTRAETPVSSSRLSARSKTPSKWSNEARIRI